MKKYFTYGIALVGIGFLALSGSAVAEEDGATKVEASASLGFSLNDTNDRTSRAAEYESLADEDFLPIFGASLFVEGDKTEFSFDGMYLDDQDMEFEGHLDFNRVLGIEAEYQKFYHRMGQDELLNMRATSSAPGQGAQLWHSYEYAPSWDVNSDTAPEKEFGINWSQWEAEGIIRLPNLPGVILGLSASEQFREGNEQSMAMSKCSSCHIVSHDKDVDETTRDFKPFIKADLGQLSLEYSFLYREFVNDSNPTMHRYDPATHPFDASSDKYGGVNYDYRDGDLEIDRIPETEKFVNTVKAKYDIDASQNVFASYINARTTNTSVDELGRVADGGSNSELDVDYNAGMLSWTSRLNQQLKLNLSGRYQDIDADDATYTLKGKTGSPADDKTYTRESEESRDIYKIKADVVYRALSDVTFRGGYEFESISRDNPHFLVENDNDIHRLQAKARWRAARGLNFNAGYKFTYDNDPYTIENAAYPTHIDLGVNDQGYWDGFINAPVSGTYAVGAARTPQRYSYGDYVYGVRSENLSTSPEYENQLKLKANWIPTDSNMFVDGYLKYTYGSNDQDLSYDYKNQLVDTGLDVTFNPAQTLSLTFGYNYFKRKTDSEFYIPYYHG
ncbi:MAG: hypothetical protein GQ559_08735 [Desulfobulbaceae bacterium]|nr:hypothetical protein [Desulfobulbaceae bacterium]